MDTEIENNEEISQLKAKIEELKGDVVELEDAIKKKYHIRLNKMTEKREKAAET